MTNAGTRDRGAAERDPRAGDGRGGHADAQAGPAPAPRLDRHRVVLVIGALVVLVVQGGAQPPGPALGAANAAPTGSKALVAGAPRDTAST